VRIVWSMLKLVLTADIGFAERVRCLGAVAAFAAHPKKWKRLVVDGLRAIGVRVAVPEDAMRDAAFARIDTPAVDGGAKSNVAASVLSETSVPTENRPNRRN